MPLNLQRTLVTAEDLAVTDPLYKAAEPDTESPGAGADIHGYVFAILERLKDTSRGRKASICQIEKMYPARLVCRCKTQWRLPPERCSLPPFPDILNYVFAGGEFQKPGRPGGVYA